ncbi:MAG: hypothetical protein AAFO29_17790, partial [Actinomycetota bacterium]
MTEHLNAVVHDGSGPPALIVHGALASRSYWADNIEALAQVCQPVVVELWPRPIAQSHRPGPL